jgi:hypothetical protein
MLFSKRPGKRKYVDSLKNIEQLVNIIFHRFRTPSWKRTAKHLTDRNTTSAGEAVFLSSILLGDKLSKAARLGLLL